MFQFCRSAREKASEVHLQLRKPGRQPWIAVPAAKRWTSWHFRHGRNRGRDTRRFEAFLALRVLVAGTPRSGCLFPHRSSMLGAFGRPPVASAPATTALSMAWRFRPPGRFLVRSCWLLNRRRFVGGRFRWKGCFCRSFYRRGRVRCCLRRRCGNLCRFRRS